MSSDMLLEKSGLLYLKESGFQLRLYGTDTFCNGKMNPDIKILQGCTVYMVSDQRVFVTLHLSHRLIPHESPRHCYCVGMF